MTKRLIDIEDDLLDQARTLTGATTIKETVNTSLREVVNAELRRQHLVRLITGEGTDIADDEVMADAWR
ncbi:MAG: type II toxin-antitoxin system VapB family antitoxin [bacterium]|nr:type II toxin-antitoxin system VapB family antitoxin [bacterium]MDE0601101.1 type II toxin-antitoxin system VapB family antitoxin [bacterium]